MAAIVYNGLQSCLESQVIESRVLRLKLSPLPPSSSSSSSTYSFNSQSIELALKSSFWDPNGKSEDVMISKKNTSFSFHDCNSGDFSSPGSLKHVQTLLGTKEPLEELSTNTTTSTYVPSMLKRSSLVLSERSLQLCTENLGNETGTDMMESGIGSLENEGGGKVPATRREEARPALPRRRRSKKAIDVQSFPPPLTTIRGSEYLSVTPHRENGRLVVKAVKKLSVSCFEAERSHGRLRLFFLKNANLRLDCEEAETEQGNEGIGKDYEEQVEDDNNGQRPKMEGGGKEEDQEDQEQEHFEDEGEGDVYDVVKDTEGNRVNVEDDIGIVEDLEFDRSRWCKEREQESNSLLNWDTHLVATS